jgi:hypothetical protein
VGRVVRLGVVAKRGVGDKAAAAGGAHERPLAGVAALVDRSHLGPLERVRAEGARELGRFVRHRHVPPHAAVGGEGQRAHAAPVRGAVEVAPQPVPPQTALGPEAPAARIALQQRPPAKNSQASAFPNGSLPPRMHSNINSTQKMFSAANHQNEREDF